MDALDRRIINTLQDGFPVCARPYAEAARRLEMSEADLIERLERLLADGVLSRFGPMYNADRLGGEFVLAAMAVPTEQLDKVAAVVNGYDEIAHNYARDHRLNMWFVLAADRPGRTERVLREIESRTGLEVLAFPKLDEFFVGLRFQA